MTLQKTLFNRTFTLLCIVLLLTSSILLFLLYQRYQVVSARRAEVYVTFLASQCVNPVLQEDRLQLKSLFQVTKDKEVAAYVWLEHNNSVLVHTFPQGMPKGLLELRPPGSIGVLTVRWQDQHKQIFRDISVPLPAPAGGILHMGVSQNQVDKTFTTMLPFTGGIILLSLAFGAAFSWRMSTVITKEIKSANQALEASELKYQTLAENTYDWEFWSGPEGEPIYNSPSCERIIGYSVAELAADPDLCSKIIHPDDRQIFNQHRHTATQKHQQEELELRVTSKNGELRWISHRCRPVFGKQGEYLGTRGANTDITQRKELEHEISHMAFYDALTDLPNRRLLMDRLQQALVVSARNGQSGAVLFIDLDNFKKLNDQHGHDMGDLLLQQVAQRLLETVREADTVARLGGDEFVVILAGLGTEPQQAITQATLVGDKIIASLNEKYQLNCLEYFCSSSIGARIFNGRQTTASDLLKQADSAMYQAKAAGRNTLRFWS